VAFVRAEVDDLDISVSRGQATTWTLDFVDEAPGDVSLWIGGDADDLDDTTGATEVVGTVASFVATFVIPAQTTARQDLRLERDGEMVTSGTLYASVKGKRTSTQSYTVNLGATETTAQIVGGSPEVAAGLAALPDLVDGIGTEQRNPSVTETTLDAFRHTGAVATVTSTASETTLAGPVTFAADALDNTRDCLRVNAWGNHTQDSGANRDLIFRLETQDGDTVFTWTFAAVPASATARSWRISCDLVVDAFLTLTLLGGVGIATLSAAGSGVDFGSATAAGASTTVDLTASMPFVVTVQHATNAASISTTSLGFHIERSVR
jgi:hypothetical protein